MSDPQQGDGRDLRDRLRELRVDPPGGEDFSAALHRRLVAAEAPDEPGLWLRIKAMLGERRAFWPALGAAAAACAVLVAVLGRPAFMAQRPPATLAAAEFPATKVAVVRVNLTASVAVEQAHIRVSLPEGLVFWADGQELAQRSFEWSQPLSAGDNDIPIAVRGQKPGRYRLTLSAQINGERVDDEVLLDVVDG